MPRWSRSRLDWRQSTFDHSPPAPAQILVPFEIGRRRADARDVDAAVAVEIHRRTSRAGHAAVVERCARPGGAIAICRVDPNAVRSTTLPEDHLVDAVAVQIAGDERVSIDDARVDHLSRERSRRTKSVRDDLIAM